MRSLPVLLLLVVSFLCNCPAAASYEYTETKDEAFGQVEGGDCYAVDKSYEVSTYEAAAGKECTSTLAVYDYYNSACDTGWPRDKYHNIKILTNGCSQSCLVTIDYMNNCHECTVNDAGDEITLVDCSNVPGIIVEPQTIQIQMGGGYLKLQDDEEKCLHPAVLEDFVRNGPECRDAPSEFESEGPSMITSGGPSMITTASQGPSIAPSLVPSEEEEDPVASTCYDDGFYENGDC